MILLTRCSPCVLYTDRRQGGKGTQALGDDMRLHPLLVLLCLPLSSEDDGGHAGRISVRQPLTALIKESEIECKCISFSGTGFAHLRLNTLFVFVVYPAAVLRHTLS